MSKSVGVKKKSIWRDKASWELLILCVPTLLAFTLFHYVPMIGIILPFRRFMPAKGLFGSPWVGFENFRFLFTSVELARIMLCGGIWAGVGCVIALATETASAAYLAPLCLCYALMMIGTRFFPDAMMLNPMQWVSGATWFLTIVLAFTLALQALFLKRGAQKYV